MIDGIICGIYALRAVIRIIINRYHIDAALIFFGDLLCTLLQIFPLTVCQDPGIIRYII